MGKTFSNSVVVTEEVSLKYPGGFWKGFLLEEMVACLSQGTFGLYF